MNRDPERETRDSDARFLSLRQTEQTGGQEKKGIARTKATHPDPHTIFPSLARSLTHSQLRTTERQEESTRPIGLEVGLETEQEGESVREATASGRREKARATKSSKG